jgi:diguanylate cyclase (GGDEF)-like protein
MYNKKRNKIIASIVIVLIILSGILYFVLTFTSNDNSLSIIENKWITSNTNTIVDVDIYNDIPLYGYNGSGICFEFLDSFTEKYGINFSKRSYYSNSDIDYDSIAFKVVNPNKKLGSNDILFYEDEYVVISEDDSLSDLNDIKMIGILTSDREFLTDYLGDGVQYKEYDNIDSLINGIKEKEIDYGTVPNVMYMNEILKDNLNIVYHISDLSKKYVLNVKDDTVYNIMKKHYANYLKNDFQDDYSKEYINTYFAAIKADDILQKNYNSKIYKYGYVVNMPYENYANSSFVGTVSNYLMDFEKVANVEIEVIRYNSIDDLKSALVSGEVDFALTNFDDTSINVDNIKTLAFKNEDYLVLSGDDIAITSIKGLVDYKVDVIGSSNLHHLCIDNDIKVNLFKDTNDLIRNIGLDDIILLDKDTYNYYKNEKLKDYKIIYEGRIDNGYKFIINASDEMFAKIFNYYVSSMDYNNIKYDYNTNVMLKEENNSVKIVVLITVIIVVLVVLLLVINKKRNKGISNLSRDDMIRYIDPMTSLKNRAYLNNNIYNWDDNVIFPQSIIVYDINKLREINDKYGRETGDEVIKKVASILINNQLENTDIIRSDGDEFVIYMIGYDTKKTIEYAKKLAKEMKNISKSTGVSFGYSMILDEVKTIDDAINESITMLQKSK